MFLSRKNSCCFITFFICFFSRRYSLHFCSETTRFSLGNAAAARPVVPSERWQRALSGTSEWCWSHKPLPPLLTLSGASAEKPPLLGCSCQAKTSSLPACPTLRPSVCPCCSDTVAARYKANGGGRESPRPSGCSCGLSLTAV